MGWQVWGRLHTVGESVTSHKGLDRARRDIEIVVEISTDNDSAGGLFLFNKFAEIREPHVHWICCGGEISGVFGPSASQHRELGIIATPTRSTAIDGDDCESFIIATSKGTPDPATQMTVINTTRKEEASKEAINYHARSPWSDDVGTMSFDIC